MDADYFRTLFEYDAWARNRVFAACRAISEDDYSSSREGLGTIRGTLVHALFAQTLWLARCQGLVPTGLYEADLPKLQQLEEHWRQHDQEMLAYLKRVGETDLGKRVTYRTAGGQEYTHSVAEMLAQAVNHTTQHRSEVALVLTQLSHSPGDLDLVVYLRLQERAAR